MEETKEKKIFAVYEFGLLLKTMQALLEVGIGAVLYFISTNNIVNFILKIIHGELVEDPNDSNTRYCKAHNNCRFVTKKKVGLSCGHFWTWWVNYVSDISSSDKSLYSPTDNYYH